MGTRKSNRGQPIDMEALIAANKRTPAVGNMRVNAAGDVIGTGGEVIKNNEERVREYYTKNPRSSTSKVSLKGKSPGLTPDADVASSPIKPKTAKTAAENVRTAQEPTVSDTVDEIISDKKKASKKEPVPVVEEPEEFDAPLEPLGFKEVELPNGDIEMVPYYKEDDAG